MGLIILKRTGSLSRGDFYPGIKKNKVMFYGTIRDDDFQRNTASQCCNHSKQYRNNVATPCYAKNLCESRSRITSPLNNDERRQRERKKINSFRLAKLKLGQTNSYLQVIYEEDTRVRSDCLSAHSHTFRRGNCFKLFEGG